MRIKKKKKNDKMTNFYQPDMQAYLNRYYIFFNVVVHLDWLWHMADQTLGVALNQELEY